MNFIGLWLCREHWHLVKLRLSYKQLVFHIHVYLHRFNIINIVTFNNLPCFVQLKSSHASVFFFLVETPVQSRSTHGFCHFIKINALRLFHHHCHKHHFIRNRRTLLEENSGAPWARTSNLSLPSLTRSPPSFLGRYVEWDLNIYCTAHCLTL